MTDTQTTTDSTADKDAEIEKWKGLARKHEKEAKANADAADRLAKLEQDQLSKEEKLAEELATARKDADDAKAESLRWKIAARHGISDEDAELFLLGKDEDTLTKQATRLSGRQAEQTRKTGNVVPKEGTSTPNPKEDELKVFTRSLFAQGEGQP